MAETISLAPQPLSAGSRYVTSESAVLQGEPIILGTEVAVRDIVVLWKSGEKPEDIPRRLFNLVTTPMSQSSEVRSSMIRVARSRTSQCDRPSDQERIQASDSTDGQPAIATHALSGAFRLGDRLYQQPKLRRDRRLLHGQIHQPAHRLWESHDQEQHDHLQNHEG
jgi:hypothetical protein